MFIWILVFGLFVFILRPAFRWPILGEFLLFDMYTLMPFLAFAWIFSWAWNSDAKRLPGNILVWGMLLYTLVVFASLLFTPFTSLFDYQPPWFRFMVFFVIILTSIKTERDLKIFATAFPVFFFLDMALSYWNYQLGNVFVTTASFNERLTSQGPRDNVNMYSALLVCMLPMTIPLVTLCKKYWHYLFVLGYACLTIRVMTLTGSRTGLIMLVVLAIFFTLFSRYRFRILPVILLIFLLGWFALPENAQFRYRTIIDPTLNRWDTDSAMGRWDDLNRGLRIMRDYPILGIGVGTGLELAGGKWAHHNLIGQLAAQTGAVGIAAFLFLLSCFGINHYNIWRNYKYLQEKNLSKEGLYCFRISIASMYGVFMLVLMGFGMGSAFFHMWTWFAALQIAAAMILQEKVTAAMQGKLLPSLPVRK